MSFHRWSNYIGRIIYLHLASLLKRSLLHIYVKYCDSLCFPGIGVGSTYAIYLPLIPVFTS